MSLRLRLTVLTGLLTGGTVLLFALVFYLVLQDDLLDEVDGHLRERAELVIQTLKADGDLSNDNSLPPPSALVEFTTPGIYVALLSPDGQLRATSANLPGGRLPTAPDLIEAAQRGSSATGTMTTGTDEQLRLLVMPVHLGGQLGPLLVVAESLEPVQRTLAQARGLLLMCGALALGLAAGGAAMLTGQALGPIARLTRAAANIAATGHYQERVPQPRRNDEIGQLATTINELIATVERTLGQQRQFLADTSHELRSPLTVVLANLNLLRRDLDQHEREVSVQEATAEAQRMRKLVNDLLLLAQADVAQVIAQTPVRLDQLAEEVVATARRQAADRQISTQIEAPMIVTGDWERLTQLLRNVLENALYHTPPDTRIDVRLRRSDSMAQLVVADTGPGIPAEHLPRIWDRFYRVDKARSRTLGGTGLGLAIVKYIAEAHGGNASVVSEPARGTTFTVVLPLSAEMRIAERSSQTASAWAGQS
jgi:two-component system, OmpR family, sensor kinase